MAKSPQLTMGNCQLKILGSSSEGNCYLLCCGEEILIIEAGRPWKEIVKGLDYDLSKAVGCIVSHSHQDHSKSIKDVIKCSIPVYSTKEVQSVYSQTIVPKMGIKTRIGGFTIQPLLVPHSVECYAYIITHPSLGKLVFATDCSEFKYKIKNVNHWIIEANYSEEIIIENLCNNKINRSLYRNHLEINDTIDALKHNFCPDTQTIVLIHLSSSNSDEKSFARRVKDELGFDNVTSATPGQITNLEKEEF